MSGLREYLVKDVNKLCIGARMYTTIITRLSIRRKSYVKARQISLSLSSGEFCQPALRSDPAVSVMVEHELAPLLLHTLSAFERFSHAKGELCRSGIYIIYHILPFYTCHWWPYTQSL